MGPAFEAIINSYRSAGAALDAKTWLDMARHALDFDGLQLALRGMATGYASQGSYLDASLVLKEALIHRPGNLVINTACEIIGGLLCTGQDAEAQDLYGQLRQAGPGVPHWAFATIIRKLATKGDYITATKWFDRAMQERAVGDASASASAASLDRLVCALLECFSEGKAMQSAETFMVTLQKQQVAISQQIHETMLTAYAKSSGQQQRSPALL